MKKIIVLISLCMLLVCVFATSQAQLEFPGQIILGRADTTSITASITSQDTTELYLVWGPSGGNEQKQSEVFTCCEKQPAVITMDGFTQGQSGVYQLFWRVQGTDAFSATEQYTFQLPRLQGETFNFVIQADSHLLNKADPTLYRQSMETMAALKPDLLMDLGDTFLLDQRADALTQTNEAVEAVYRQQLPYFSIVARSTPLYLVVGNHEGEYGAYETTLAAQSMQARLKYYLNPIPNNFYSGNTQDGAQNYYAYTWGDALFVVIDPYRYTTMDPNEKTDGWGWTLGKVQYDWFCQTLLESDAKYKFVFSHHAIGNIRGGKDIAALYEWGGYDQKGNYLFDEKRPGWGKPIHQIMVDAGVNIFFQGHDHLFAREEVDGIIYQTLPKPAEKVADKQNNFDAYPDADVMLNAGFLNVTISAQSVRVDYIRNYFVSSLGQEGNTGCVYSYEISRDGECRVLIDHQDDPSTYATSDIALESSDETSENAKNDPQKNKNASGNKNSDKQTKLDAAVPVAITDTLTSVPANGYAFCIQADSHLDDQTDTQRYRAALLSIAQTDPAFVIDLGDTFMSEKLANTQEEVNARYQLAFGYFDLLGDIPLYLVNGNHDGESGVLSLKNDMPQWCRSARQTYFPYPGDNIDGNIETANYYTFTIGDVQMIVLDPFTYTDEKVKKAEDGWNTTLGDTQYEWLRSVLQSSTAKYKLIFIHHLVGGYGKDQRGGAEASRFFEWGGYSADGSIGFAAMRPGWEAPIHDLLVKYGVDIVFHGHDHFYAKQERDGIIYQLVPQPGTPGNSIASATDYGYLDGTFLPSPGFLRVIVSPENLTVEYIFVNENGLTIADIYLLAEK